MKGHSTKMKQPPSLSNSEVHQLLAQRTAELAVIKSVQKGMAAEMDMQGIYDLVGDRIRDLFDAQVAAIATFHHDSKTEHFQYLHENGERVYPDSRPYDKLRQRLIDTHEVFNIEENALEFVTDIFDESPKSVPGTLFPKSMVFVPISNRNQVLGYVSLQNLDREHAFGESDIHLLTTIVNSMGMALENARLYHESEQRNAELAVINSVQHGLAAELDMEGIYDLVGDRIRDLFDSQVAAIATFDYEHHTEEFNYIYEEGERYYMEPRPIDKVRQRLIDTRETLCINENADDVWQEITGEEPTVIPGTKLTKSALYVPMLVGSEVRGYVSLQNLDREHAYTDQDIRLLNTLVNSMTVALENARLFSESEQRNAELAVINSVQQGLVAEMDMQGIYELVGDRLREVFDAQVTGIVTLDLNSKTEHFQYAYEEGERIYPTSRPYDKVREKVIQNRSPLLIAENAAKEMSEINGKPFKPVPGTRMAQTALYVPMIVGDEVKGYVTIQNNDREHAFNESDVKLLRTLTYSLSIALENARLFNETTRLLAETEQRNAELAVINSVQEGLVREMDMENIYSLVGNRICEVLNTQTMLIRTFDHEKRLEIWEYAIENGERMHIEPRPFIWANEHLIKTKEPFLINDNYIETARKYGDTEQGVSKGLPPKSAIFVPMMVGDVVMGSVSLQNVEKENAFTESDVRLLSTLTNSMSVALENARLFNETTRLLAETKQRAAEMQTVNKISRAMVSLLEFDNLVKLVGEQMRDTFQADIVYLAIHDRKSNMLHFPYYYGDPAESRPFGNGITERIILDQKPLLINQDMAKVYDRIKAKKMGRMVQSYIGVPIISGDQAIGVISVQSTEEENRFTDSDLRLLSTIAANVGVAMQNAEAYQKLQATLSDLKMTQEQLIQSEKMASLGELTAGIAHEIKNPLNFVNNFSEINTELIGELKEEIGKLKVKRGKEKEGSSKLKAESSMLKTQDSEMKDEDSYLDEAGDEDLIDELLRDIQGNEQKITHHGKRADAIVRGMLQHSRGSEGQKELTDLNALCDEYLRLAYHGLRAKDKTFNAAMKTDFDESLPMVNVIPQDLGRVVLNLITNAFYACTERSRSTIAVETHDRASHYQPTVTVRTQYFKNENKVEIIVKDNGNGIPHRVLDKIFQPFFTTKPTGEGTGLGLSMSYDIVTKSHGGDINVHTEEGIGTEFLLLLPAV